MGHSFYLPSGCDLCDSGGSVAPRTDCWGVGIGDLRGVYKLLAITGVNGFVCFFISTQCNASEYADFFFIIFFL